MHPRYRSLSDRDIARKAADGREMLSSCTLCPRQCRANRVDGQAGFCRAGVTAAVSHWQVHHGEEPALAEAGGAGAIFFAHCTLACVFCQNYQISQQAHEARLMSGQELAHSMLSLQAQGAQNIDLVSPTQFVPQIIDAIQRARRDGLNIPLVYNTNGYESLETLRLLDGLIDIYLPDLKYGDDRFAQRYSGAADYLKFVRPALAQMLEQTGSLKLDSRGRAQSGVIVRHLVLPHDQAATAAVLAVLAQLEPQRLGLSLMSQYAPCYRAARFPKIRRPLQAAEYEAAVAAAERMDFAQCWIQELVSNTCYFPDFEREQVFRERRAEDAA